MLMIFIIYALVILTIYWLHEWYQYTWPYRMLDKEVENIVKKYGFKTEFDDVERIKENMEWIRSKIKNSAVRYGTEEDMLEFVSDLLESTSISFCVLSTDYVDEYGEIKIKLARHFYTRLSL